MLLSTGWGMRASRKVLGTACTPARMGCMTGGTKSAMIGMLGTNRIKEATMKRRIWGVLAAVFVALSVMVVFAPTQAQANTWVKYRGAYYCLDNGGNVVTDGWASYNGAYYYLGSNGRVKTNSWVTYDGAYYYVGSNGRVVVNTWVKYGSTYYYMGSNGQPVVNDVVEYKGTYYFMGSEGTCVLTSKTIEDYYNGLDYSTRAEIIQAICDAAGYEVDPLVVQMLSYMKLDFSYIVPLIQSSGIDFSEIDPETFDAAEFLERLLG